ncbi:minor tail protein [Microbacterium phage Eleri]|uniref:Minor tail protein n=2 Tax=Elerivirus eleri TaxID=2560589 RepID=A0A6N0A4E8_9CAUD|nr:minor tail protein [Microbacterium phage Eleri]AUX83355.1 minor tail protein [Microbacterium phage Eleri]QKO02645.1 minor tail protein [Microbacterium phage Glamour]UDG78976.1 minor tail protein [Microbacterium phage Saratos]
MSFKLGTFDTDSVTGFKAILQEWPVLPVELLLDELPAGDGSMYYRSRMESTEWVFNLELTGSDIYDVMAKADTISRALNPKLGGIQDFTPNAMDGYVWQGLLAGIIEWERDKVIWFSDQGVSRLSGTATISTPDPYGYALGDDVVLAAPGTLALTGEGTTSFYPVIEFRGVLNTVQRFNAGPVQIAGPLTASQTLVLDFQNMDFFIKTTATGAKVRSVADRFTAFTRLEGLDSLNVPVSVSAGTFTQAVGRVSSRRI